MTRRAALAALVAAACLRAAAAAPSPATVTTTATSARSAHADLQLSPMEAVEAVHVLNPHDHKGKPYCHRCHAGGQKAVVDPIALCGQCHTPSLMKHPFGVPAKTVPAALPLGPEGTIVCHTCHDPHDVKKHRKGLRLDYMPLCAQCHAKHGAKSPAAPAK